MAPTLLFQQPIGYWWLPMLKTSTYVDVLKFRRFLSITLLRRRFFTHYQFYVCVCVWVRENTDWLLEHTWKRFSERVWNTFYDQWRCVDVYVCNVYQAMEKFETDVCWWCVKLVLLIWNAMDLCHTFYCIHALHDKLSIDNSHNGNR